LGKEVHHGDTEDAEKREIAAVSVIPPFRFGDVKREKEGVYRSAP
jgi:hypothetical protein